MAGSDDATDRPPRRAADLRERPGAAVSRLRLGLKEAAHAQRRGKGTAAEPETRLALVVNQTEELFTAETVGAEARARLDAALAALVTSGAVWVLATLRSDFYERFTELPELMRAKEGAGQHDLPAPEPEEIARMIREPAEIAGLRFEVEPESGRRLDDVVRDAAVADPGALPLLEFTLDELYRRRSEDGVLIFAAYEALGGIEGALAHRADEVYAALAADARAALDPVLLSLVRLSPEADAPPSRRRAPRASLAAIAGAAALLEAFVAARLLTADRSPGGAGVVSVSHEALLRAWPRAVEWRERHAGLLRTRARVESQAATWTAEGEAPGFLLPEGQLLADAGALLDHPGAPLGAREERLVRTLLEAAADRRRRRTLRWRWTAAAGLLAALSAVLVWDLFYRPQVGWYGSVVFRDGVPHGVGEPPHEEGLPFAALDRLVGNETTVFQIWIEHPTPDAYWDAMAPSAEDYARLDLPILTLTGTYDGDLRGALYYYRRHHEHGAPEALRDHYLVIGPWDHAGTRTPRREVGGLELGPASMVDMDELHRQWYDWTLRGGDKPELLRDRVAYYVAGPGAEEWRWAPSLEAIPAEPVAYHLGSDGRAGDVFHSGTLTREPREGAPWTSWRHDPTDNRKGLLSPGVFHGLAGEVFDPEVLQRYVLDQRFALALDGDGVVFHTAPVEGPFEIVGAPRLETWVETETPDADFDVRLYEVLPDGTSIALSDDMLRARYRSSLRRAEPVPVGEPMRLVFDAFQLISRRIGQGSRLRLVMTSPSSITLERNYNAGGEVARQSAADARAATIRLHHSAKRPAVLTLPVVPVQGPDG